MHLPAVSLAQAGNVRRVVAAVPLVDCQGFGEILAAVLGMVEAFFEIVFGHGLQQAHPALVQRVDDGERAINGQLAIGEPGPGCFVIRLDGGPIFSERELETDEGVGMAVGDVMDQLTDRPAAFSVGRVELGVAETADGGAELRRKLAHNVDVRVAGGGVITGGRLEAANWIAGVVQFGHGRNITMPGGGIAVLQSHTHSVESLWARVLVEIVVRLSPRFVAEAVSKAGCELGGMVVVMVVAMMMHCGKYRSGNHHEEQRGNKNPFHATNLA